MREIKAYEHLKAAWGRLVPAPKFTAEAFGVIFFGMQMAERPPKSARVEDWDDALFELEEKYGKPNYARLAYVGSFGLLALLLFGGVFLVLSRPSKVRRRRKIEIDENPTPFTAIALLQDIHQNNGLNRKRKKQLGESINRLEQYYFGENNGQRDPEPDLVAEIRKWTRLASG